MYHKTLKCISAVLIAFLIRGDPCTQVWRSKFWNRSSHHTAIIIKAPLVFPDNTLWARVSLQRYSSTWNKEALKRTRKPEQEVQEEKAFYCHGLCKLFTARNAVKGIISISTLRTWNSFDFCLLAESFYHETHVYMHRVLIIYMLLFHLNLKFTLLYRYTDAV